MKDELNVLSLPQLHRQAAEHLVDSVHRVRRTLVYVSALVENRDSHSMVADATATLMEVKTVVDPIGR